MPPLGAVLCVLLQGPGPAIDGRNSPGLGRRSADVGGAWGHKDFHATANGNGHGHFGNGHHSNGGSASNSRRTSIEGGRSSAHLPSPLKPPSKPASPAPTDVTAHMQALHLNPAAKAFLPPQSSHN